MVDIGGTGQGIERGPSERAPGALGHAAGAPSHGPVFGGRDGKGCALAPEVEVEENQRMARRGPAEVLGEHPCVPPHARALCDGRLDIDTDPHGTERVAVRGEHLEAKSWIRAVGAGRRRRAGEDFYSLIQTGPYSIGPAERTTSEESDRQMKRKRKEPRKKGEDSLRGAKEQAEKKADAGAEAKADSVEALQERLLRLQADFDNFRKRTLREKDELYRRANEDLMTEALPVLDHMELALEHARANGEADPLAEGFALVWEQMLSVLGKFGLEPIDAEGKEFDPNIHEAVSHLPSAEVPGSVVMTQTRRGYMLGGRVLRAAQVVVSSGAGGDGEPSREGPKEGAERGE
jgi:molecular chaperone GrpE